MKKKIETFYCEKCGAVLVEKRIPTGRFSVLTGKPTFNIRLVCPNKPEGFLGKFSKHTELKEFDEHGVEVDRTGEND